MIIDPYTWHRLPIQYIDHLTPDTVSVRLPRPDGYRFRAGQYAIVRVTIGGVPLLRQYSFASAPDNDFIELLIQRETDGEVSGWFYGMASAGDSVEISQAFGSFTWNGDDASLLLIAGRVGIAPLLSIIRQHELDDASSSITVLYSVREPDQVCYRELLKGIATSFFVTSIGERITGEAIKKHITPQTTAYICGSKRFVDGITNELQILGVEDSHLKRERFTLQ